MAPKLQHATFLFAALVVTFSAKVKAHHDGHSNDLGFSSCVSDCIEGSGCSAANVKCMCRASQGSFLADVVVCTYSDCSQAISVDDLLSPLELACGVLGEPIPDSAIASAEAAQSSIDNPKPSTTRIVVSETTTAKTTTSGKTTYTATSKATTTVPKSTSTSKPTSVETDSVTETSTSLQNTGGAGVSTTTTAEDSSSTGVHLSFDTSSQTTSSSATTTTTAGPVDPTDSSPFATPINSGGSNEQASFLGAVVGLAAILAFGW